MLAWSNLEDKMHLGHLQGTWRQARTCCSPRLISKRSRISLPDKFRLCISPPSRTKHTTKPNDLEIFSPQPAFQPPSEELASATSNPLSTPLLIRGERVINELADAQVGRNLPDLFAISASESGHRPRTRCWVSGGEDVLRNVQVPAATGIYL